MNRSRISLVVTVLLAFAAGIAGVWVGHAFLVNGQARGTSVHDIIHEQLDLNPAQQKQIDKLEADFAVQRNQLELEMRMANVELANAIREEHGYGPKVTAAVDHFHRAMGELQKETLSHVFAMRAVLTPDQAETFDRTVVEALIAESR